MTLNTIFSFLNHRLITWLTWITWLALVFILTPNTPSFASAIDATRSSDNVENNNVEIDHAPFADSLTNELYKNPNECTSSLGVSMALSLVYPSATQDAYTQMKHVLNYPKDQLQLVWEDTSESLTSRYRGSCYRERNGECTSQEPLLEIANTVWIHDEIDLDPTYESVVGEYLQQLNFNSDEAGGIVNDWVYESTNGLIDSIVDEGKLVPWILLALNSIYLKASWVCQFKEENTNRDFFYKDASRKKKVGRRSFFMHQVETFPYSNTAIEEYQIVQLPFEASSDSLSMIIALPSNSNAANADNAPMVTSSEIIAALPQLSPTTLALALPKFKFSSKYEETLKQSLKTLGMMEPFNNNLCIEEGYCDACIDKIIQKTFIDVNEMGVEAAAVTAVAVKRRSGGRDPRVEEVFVADYPFQFFIYDEVENVVLFEGRFGLPDLLEGEGVVGGGSGSRGSGGRRRKAPLRAKHKDEDFWSKNFGVDVSSTISASSSSVSYSKLPAHYVMNQTASGSRMSWSSLGLVALLVCGANLVFMAL